MTVPHHYSMKWDNYHSHVGDIFSQLLETGSMADVILYAEGEKINCHKMLLSACSPYFQEILSSAGGSNTIVVVSGICGEDVRSIIEFVYRGEISVKADRFGSVLKAAEALKICGLMEVNSHLSEMEVSEVISTAGDQKVHRNSSSKFYKEEMCDKGNRKNVVTLKENKKRFIETKTMNTRTEDGASWNCIQMPVPIRSYSADTLVNDSECLQECSAFDDADMYHKERVQTNCTQSDKTKGDSSVDLSANDLLQDEGQNISSSDENNLQIKIESCVQNEVPGFGRQDVIATNSEEELSCEESKLKRRKDIRKKLYSEEAMLAALEDMKAGKNLVKAAAKHHVPRTTLYMRARAIGACPAMVRKGYPTEKIIAALESVAGGSSLQCAATEFGIPKTVLWRRVQKEIGNNTPPTKRIKQSVVVNQVNTTKEQLVQDGVLITRVSPQYQIPKATLFRWEKVHVSSNTDVVGAFLKDKINKPKIKHETHLEESARTAECEQDVSTGRDEYKIHKESSVWSNIEQTESSSQHHSMLIKTEEAVAVEQLKQQQQTDFDFSEGVHELPVSYVNTQFPDSSIIILAPVDSNKYTLQREEEVEVPDSDKVLPSIEVSNSNSQNDTEKSD